MFVWPKPGSSWFDQRTRFVVAVSKPTQLLGIGGLHIGRLRKRLPAMQFPPIVFDQRVQKNSSHGKAELLTSDTVD